jgi:hypothetical protein
MQLVQENMEYIDTQTIYSWETEPRSEFLRGCPFLFFFWIQIEIAFTSPTANQKWTNISNDSVASVISQMAFRLNKWT